jgi:AcrR family transcriptional regulator
VLRAALELADEGGLGSVTMQRVGRRLGVEAMSLYRYVESKEDILDGLIDLVLGEIELPSSAEGWKSAMRRRALSARRVFVRHRWAIGLVESRTQPGAATLRHHEAVLATLLEAGFSGLMAAHTYTLLDSYIYGFALQEMSLPFDDPGEQARLAHDMLGQLPADEYPSMLRVTREFLEAGADPAAFEFGLDLILEGVERVSARPGRGPSSAAGGGDTRH